MSCRDVDPVIARRDQRRRGNPHVDFPRPGRAEHLLEAMANQGGGNFYFIEAPAFIPGIFEREFKTLQRLPYEMWRSLWRSILTSTLRC